MLKIFVALTVIFVCAESFTTNYYLLTLQANSNHKFGYSLHGLWPDYANSSWPSFCPKTQSFSEALVQDLLQYMEVDWPSLGTHASKNVDFWTHEWDKHGTCNWNKLDLHGYFAKTLDLFWQSEEKGYISKATGSQYSFTIDLNWNFIGV